MIVSMLAVAASPAQAQSLGDFFPGTHQEELTQLKSPDGRSTAILTDKERHGWMMPAEGAKTLERSSRLKVIRDNKTVYDSGDEPLNIYDNPFFALDLAWSPGSTHIAYRYINTLRIIGPGGKAANYSIVPADSVIASFLWRDNESLIIVSKKLQESMGSYGKPERYGGPEPAEEIHISRLHMTTGQTVRYRQPAHDPASLFHSVKLGSNQVSPKADRVVFADGVNLCVYDDTAGKVIARSKIPQEPTTPASSPNASFPGVADPALRQRFEKTAMEIAAEPTKVTHIWWKTNGQLVLGLQLSFRDVNPVFYTFDIPSQTLTDVTKALMPLWLDYDQKALRGAPNDPDWYRAGLK